MLLGAVLSQKQGNDEKVIAYASKMLSNTQKRYCTTYRELLAVVHFVKNFRHFLWGQKLLIRTDHASLVWLKNFKEPEGIVARWISVLDTYNFVIQHRRGCLHGNADALSRIPYSRCKRSKCPVCEGLNEGNLELEGCCFHDFEQQAVLPIQYGENTSTIDTLSTDSDIDSDPENEIQSNWLVSWADEQIREWQNNDSNISKILQLKSEFEHKPPRLHVSDCNFEVRSLWSNWELLEIQNEILYYRYELEQGRSSVLVAPYNIRSDIMHQLHTQRIAGHLGRDKTLKAVKFTFFWPGMSTDVMNWCRKCWDCAKGKPGPGAGKAPLQQSKVGAPFDRIGIDIVGHCPITANNNEYIIVIQDYFTKWVEAFAVPNHTAQTVGDKLVTELFCRFGIPKQIHSDQGREFCSELMAEVCKLLEIDKTRTTPYRPQSDGLVERQNRSLKKMLSNFVNENRNDWMIICRFSSWLIETQMMIVLVYHPIK